MAVTVGEAYFCVQTNTIEQQTCKRGCKKSPVFYRACQMLIPSNKYKFVEDNSYNVIVDSTVTKHCNKYL